MTARTSSSQSSCWEWPGGNGLAQNRARRTIRSSWRWATPTAVVSCVRARSMPTATGRRGSSSSPDRQASKAPTGSHTSSAAVHWLRRSRRNGASVVVRTAAAKSSAFRNAPGPDSAGLARVQVAGSRYGASAGAAHQRRQKVGSSTTPASTLRPYSNSR